MVMSSSKDVTNPSSSAAAAASKQTTSSSATASKPVFNYAAAAAKSKAPPAGNAGSNSSNGTGAGVNGVAAVNGLLPTGGKNGVPAVAQGSGAAPASGAAPNVAPRSAVSIPRPPATAARAAAGASGINFGSDATLSSSPAQPPSGPLSKPATFGTVDATGSTATSAVDGDKKSGIVIGGAASQESGLAATAPKPAAPKPKMDFNKLFQSKPSEAPSPAPSSTAQDAADASGASSPAVAPNVARPSFQVQQQGGAHPPSGPQRSPSGQPASLNPVAGSAFRPMQGRGFEPGVPRTTSSSSIQGAAGAPSGPQPGPGSRMQAGPGGAPPQGMMPPGSPFYPGYPGAHAGNPRSPQMGHAPMPQYGMYHYPGYMQQGFPGSPGFGWQQQSPYPGSPAADMQNAPRSPAHPRMSMPQSGVNGPPTPGAAVPGGAARPPQSPAASLSGMGSPPPQQAGIATPSGRPSHIHTPSGSFSQAPTHSPSHSFSAGAASFQPTKRGSSAIKIVNPNTGKSVEVAAGSKSSQPSSIGTPAAASTPSTPGISTPSVATTAVEPPASPALSAATTESSSAAPAKDTKVKTQENFMQKVLEMKAQKLAEEQAKKDEEERKKKQAEDQKRQAEDEERRKKEEEEQKQKKEEEDRKAAEEAERKAAEDAKRAAEEEAKAQADRKAKAEADAEAKVKADADAGAKADAEANAQTKADSEAADTEKATAGKKPAPIDTQMSSDERPPMVGRNSVADVERMAREASSVPSTPMLSVPPTPRTPGTPGFAGLPAKPMSSMVPTSRDIKLDAAELEKRRKPDKLDLTNASKPSSDAPLSAAMQALGSARRIEVLSEVQYPENIKSPRPDLSEIGDGRFRYDRDFLMQFMGVYKEKPRDLPPLGQIGMEPGRGMAPNRRASGIGGGAAPPRGPATGLGIGVGPAFAKGAPAKSSEERFAQSQAGGARASPMGNFGGAMGSFNMGGRSTQPLARGGSGSNAIPSREMMGRPTSKRGTRRPEGMPGRSAHNPPEKGGPTIPLSEVVPLSHSETRWMPQAATGRGQGIKQDSPEMTQRKVKALLNKLTLDNFDSIANQILSWANRSTDETDGRTLRQVIALVFEKATDEAAFSTMYAKLCAKLQTELDPNVKDESLPAADGKPASGGQLFRKYLLNRCQEDFEKGWAQKDATAAAAKQKEADDKAKKESNEEAQREAKEAEERGEKVAQQKEAELLSEEYYVAQKAKRRGLGLVRFVGELFKLSMISDRIMHGCIKSLLQNIVDPEEEEIESLCKLLSTVGKLLDQSENGQSRMSVYIMRMRDMMKSASLNSRMRFMIQDVIELRESQWTPRSGGDTAPKTIAEVHADAARQKARQEAEGAALRARGGPMSRGGSRRGVGRDGADGWNTVGNAPASTLRSGELAKFGKITRGPGGAPALASGPQSVFAKRGNKGTGSEEGSNPPTRTSSSSNLFSLLNKEGEGEKEPKPSERPKLQLKPRTKPLPGEEKAEQGENDQDEEEEGEAEEEEEEEEESHAPADISDEEAERKIDNRVKEFFEVKDVEEGKSSVEDLPVNRRAAFIRKIVDAAINKTEAAVDLTAELLGELHQAEVIDDDMVQEGFKDFVDFLDDTAIDVPNAYSWVAALIVGAGLSKEKIEAMADSMEGEGDKTPKERFMEKVEALLAA